MFFFLSKLLTFFLNPLVWTIALLVISIFISNPKGRRRCIISAISILYIFSNGWLAGIASTAWNYRSVTAEEITVPYDIGIVLTGYSTEYSSMDNFGYFHFFNDSANRLTQSLELYHYGKVKKLLITGGSNVVFGEKLSEATRTKRFLMHIGMPEEDILVEPSARNTSENAQFTKDFLYENDLYPEKSLLLLTSAFHMRRAKMCFDNQGLETTPFSLGNNGPISWPDLSSVIPTPNALTTWVRIMRECVGITAYYFMGFV